LSELITFFLVLGKLLVILEVFPHDVDDFVLPHGATPLARFDEEAAHRQGDVFNGPVLGIGVLQLKLRLIHVLIFWQEVDAALL